VWLTEAWSESASEIRALARDVPASIFTTYGNDVLGIPPGLAMAAIGTATFTAKDDLGYTLEAGTQFALPRSGDDLVAFEVDQDYLIPVGEMQTPPVSFTAVLTGADGNGLIGEGEMLDPVVWIDTVTVTDPTARGADAETPDIYLDRLSILMRMIALRPVLPVDFAVLALQVPTVVRAISMNLYNPVDATWTNPRMVTLILAGVDGYPLPADVKDAVKLMLENLREVNWTVNYLDPTFTPIDVTYEVMAFAGQDGATVKDACDQALTDYLTPINYRLNEASPSTAGGEVIYPPNGTGTTRQQYIYVNELIALLDRCLGVDRVVTVTINGAAQDFLMPDPYSFPEPGAITGTVTGGATGGGAPLAPSGPTLSTVTPSSVSSAVNVMTTLTLTGYFPDDLTAQRGAFFDVNGDRYNLQSFVKVDDNTVTANYNFVGSNVGVGSVGILNNADLSPYTNAVPFTVAE
jgi:hypothetical protein